MQKQSFLVNFRVSPQMLNPRSEQVARAPYNTVNRIAFRQQQLRQIGTILSGDSGDQRGLGHGRGRSFITLERNRAWPVSVPVMLSDRRNTMKRLRARHLIMDPAIGLFQTIAQTGGWLPAENLSDQSIVAIAPIDAF